MYPMAYHRAAQALIEKYPSHLSWSKIGDYMPGRVLWIPAEGVFRVQVAYEGWDIHGRPEAKTTGWGELRYSDGVWLVVARQRFGNSNCSKSRRV